MKTIKAVLPALLIVFAFLFFISNFIHDLKSAKKSSGWEEKENNPSKAAVEKPFAIIITSYNNADYCTKNLLSVFEQKYSNYRVLYIDDASTDDTYEKVEKCIRDSGQENRVALIRNKRSLTQIENVYRALHVCKDEEIVLLVDGSDWLAHNRVLEVLNDCYADPNIWMTYGSYCEYPSYKKGFGRGEIPRKIHLSHSYRKFSNKKFIFSHLRTAYAGLFKKIKMEDLLKDGNFMTASGERAFMLPLVEMAKEHAHYIKSILYIDNHHATEETQDGYAGYLTSLPPYAPVTDWRCEEKAVLGSDLVIYSKDRPLQLYAFLESVKKNAKGLGHLTVFYQSKDENFTKAYEEIKTAFPLYEFVKVLGDFKNQLLTAITAFPAHYILFAQDDQIVSEPIDLIECAREVQKRGAYGFFLNIGKNRTHSIPLGNLVYAWQFQAGQPACRFEMALCSKEMVLSTLKALQFSDLNSLASCIDSKKIGLCFETAKILTVPMNQDLDLLLTRFYEGLKIDLNSIFQVKHETAGAPQEPKYVKR